MNFPEKLTLAVSPEDISGGECQSDSKCAVAQCAVRTIPGNAGVSVTFDNIEVYGKDGSVAIYEADDPTKHGAFIEDFDNGLSVEPVTLTYTLDSQAEERD